MNNNRVSNLVERHDYGIQVVRDELYKEGVTLSQPIAPGSFEIGFIDLKYKGYGFTIYIEPLNSGYDNEFKIHFEANEDENGFQGYYRKFRDEGGKIFKAIRGIVKVAKQVIDIYEEEQNKNLPF